jgi:putative SOS response-associated peptidase YedK
MCGRFTLKTPASRIGELFDVEPIPDLVPRYNIAPTQEIVVVRLKENADGKELVPVRWGLVPGWAKDLTAASRGINARSETAREKPTFRTSFARRRCLVPADGFFEWKVVGKKKLPQYVRFEDGQLFAMAGLWDRWVGEGKVVETATILTCEPSSKLASLHDRMPVILSPDRYDDWLSGRRNEEILVSFDEPTFQAVTVSSVVNNARHDAPDCIEVIDDQNTPSDETPSLW